MSKFCPYCEASIEISDNEFYIICNNCAKNISLDGSGNITEEVEEEEEAEVEEEEEAAPEEEAEAAPEAEADAEAEAEADAEAEAVPEAAPEADMQEESISAEDLLSIGSSSHLEDIKDVGLDEKDLSSFSAKAMSLDFNKSCLYDLMISNIDSVDIQAHLVSILQDERLQLDMNIIAERFKNNISGCVSLKDLNVLKLSYIVQNIYNSSISVELYWKQKILE